LRSEIVFECPFIERIWRLFMKNFSKPFNRAKAFSALAFRRE
jgi:hypothetical protein